MLGLLCSSIDAREIKMKSLQERFEEKIERIPECGCWIWIGATTNRGYGTIDVNGKSRAAHRISYLLHNGSLPSELDICHRCDTPSCVNPYHLFSGTTKDNMDDAVNKKRSIRKLSEIQILKIRNDNRVQYIIAKENGVSSTTISEIKLRKSWSHI